MTPDELREAARFVLEAAECDSAELSPYGNSLRRARAARIAAGLVRLADSMP